MRITAAIAVLDDIESLEQCIAHHAKIGVESFVLYDLGSRDGSKEIVERFKGRTNVHVAHADMLTVTRRDAHQPRTPIANMMQEAALKRFQPDFLIYVDADEFWLPAGGRLRFEDYREYDLLEVRRYNVIPDRELAAGDWRFGEVALSDRVVYRNRKVYGPTLDHKTQVVRHAIGPKIAHRGTPRTVALGNHAILNGQAGAKFTPSDLVIVHFPFSTYNRFVRKIKHAATFVDENQSRMEAAEAWHWRLWVHADRQGLLREAYDSQFSSDEEIARLLRDGDACFARDLLGQAA